VASLTLQGLALRPSEPEDAHADLVAKARKVLESWRRTSDPLFWSAVEDYVRQHSFSLETQAYLMHCIAAVFSGDTMKLSNAQSEQFAGLLTETYCDALGTAATMPSSDIYRRLAEGLEATDRETGLTDAGPQRRGADRDDHAGQRHRPRRLTLSAAASCAGARRAPRCRPS
jgi:hypothetical protein